MTMIEPTKPSATSVAAADKAQAKTATNPKAVAHRAKSSPSINSPVK